MVTGLPTQTATEISAGTVTGAVGICLERTAQCHEKIIDIETRLGFDLSSPSEVAAAPPSGLPQLCTTLQINLEDLYAKLTRVADAL